MTRHDERPRLAALVLAVAASVLLFACSGPAEQREARETAPEAGTSTPAAPSAPAASVPAAPGAPPASASAGAGVSPPAPASGTPVSSGAASEVTFGTVPQDDQVATRPARPMPSAGTSRVFSNDDLKAYKSVKEEFGFGDDARRADLAGGSSGEEAGEGAADAGDRETKIAEAGKRLEDLAAELENLDKRIPSLHNPLLPRVKPLDKDADAEAGMDNVERLAHIRQRMSEIRSEMDSLQRTIEELRSAPEPDRPAADGGR